MKKVVFSLLFLSISSNAFAQNVDPSPSALKEELQQQEIGLDNPATESETKEEIVEKNKLDSVDSPKRQFNFTKMKEGVVNKIQENRKERREKLQEKREQIQQNRAEAKERFEERRKDILENNLDNSDPERKDNNFRPQDDKFRAERPEGDRFNGGRNENRPEGDRPMDRDFRGQGHPNEDREFRSNQARSDFGREGRSNIRQENQRENPNGNLNRGVDNNPPKAENRQDMRQENRQDMRQENRQENRSARPEGGQEGGPRGVGQGGGPRGGGPR